MRELSLHILDIAQNSLAADASLIDIALIEDTAAHTLRIVIADNGKGMPPELAQNAVDPFVTSRSTRKVGMGIPLFKMAAELTGGTLSLRSAPNEGTTITAEFCTDHVDFTPLGDLVSTLTLLITMNPQCDFVYHHSVNTDSFILDTRRLREQLEDVPLNEPAVTAWLKDYLTEQITNITGGVSNENY